jgi:hypothetical protein
MSLRKTVLKQTVAETAAAALTTSGQLSSYKSTFQEGSLIKCSIPKILFVSKFAISHLVAYMFLDLAPVSGETAKIFFF